MYETACFLFAYIALLLLPLSSFLGVGAPSLSLAGFMIKAVRRGSLSFSLSLGGRVCTRRLVFYLLRIYRTSAASVELVPRGWRTIGIAFPPWRHVQSCSKWLIPTVIVILIVRCCFGGLCVYETGLLLVCACRNSAASVEPRPRGSCAVAFPRWL